MTALVTHVPQQRAIQLPQAQAQRFALDRVGLGDVDGDQALTVPGHDLAAVLAGIGVVGQEGKAQRRVGAFGVHG